jgi:glycosyltransferase XagB
MAFVPHDQRDAPAFPASAKDGADQDLPNLPYDILVGGLQRLSPEDQEIALRHKLVPAAWISNETHYACATKTAFETAKQWDKVVVAKVTQAEYRRAVHRVLGKNVLRQAVNRLSAQFPEFSNKAGPALIQLSVIIWMIGAILLMPYVLPKPLDVVLVSLVAAMFFSMLVSVRILCLLPTGARQQNPETHIPEHTLPVYSVLVPVFHEARVLPQLIQALSELDYPREKLDIKVIMEETDSEMHIALSKFDLPENFDILVVPSGLPQTKPRALNYGLAFSRGELVTIYDAEDIPDPKQLRIAAQAFRNAGPDLACVQAELAFFNARENWLTRQFATEYVSLFGVILPKLAELGLPLPLGGTSNHFRRRALEAAGCWDPFNVTEDADLGIRLARMGYRTAMIPSVTFEEANTRLMNWIRQRSRWLKGFLSTWLVHMRHPRKCWRDLGPAGFWTMSAMTFGVFASAILHPVLIVKTAMDVASSAPPLTRSMLTDTLIGVSILLFLSGYLTAALIAWRGFRSKGLRCFSFTIATMPIYWLLLMPAALLALYDTLVKPFHWRKTEHGLSRWRRRANAGKRKQVAD